MDDIILVFDGSDRSLSTLYEVLMVFCKASGMIINEDKSSFYYFGLEESELISIQNIFSFNVDKIEYGMKYLGFHLKPCRYLLKDWDWLIKKVEKRIKNWSFRWLSKGGKLIWLRLFLRPYQFTGCIFGYLWEFLKESERYVSNSYGLEMARLLDYHGLHGRIWPIPSLWEAGV